ncbi:MAG: hypothetical protein B6245_01150 [Desulfobacteraceae bacterium 4572_88]|nr:MAG: hypothetical protein B6245_01150 [Desulfobacteraceae bacterium 4572_88]
MRFYVGVLIILSYFMPSFAMSADVILGKIISAEQESGKFVVRVLGDDISEAEKDGGSTKDITVEIPQSRLPEHVEVGSTVRIWGSYVQGNTMKFQAHSISKGNSMRHRSDPTGVRSRLDRGRMGMGRMRRGGTGGHHQRH